MRIQTWKAAALATILVLGAGSVSAYALDVSVGGGGGNVATGTTGSAAGTASGVSVGTTSGPLVNSNTCGTKNNARVNLKINEPEGSMNTQSAAIKTVDEAMADLDM